MQWGVVSGEVPMKWKMGSEVDPESVDDSGGETT